MILQEYKEKRLQDPNFAEAYDVIQAEMKDLRAKLSSETCTENSNKNVLKTENGT